jgi:hypothetical protein
MSIRVMAAVWELSLPRGEKLVLLAIADHADDSGIAFPSVRRLAWKSGYSERQCQQVLKSLRHKQILQPVANLHGGRGHAVRYKINTQKGEVSTPFETERVQSGSGRVQFSTIKGAVATAPESSGITKESSKAAGQQDTVWAFLKIKPCGPSEFRVNLESRWKEKKDLSSVGNCVDHWEKLYGQPPTGCAGLFRSLAQLRKKTAELSVVPRRQSDAFDRLVN